MRKYIRLLGLNLFIMFIFSLTIFIANSPKFQIQRCDITIVITFLLIGLISIIGIISDKNFYSINLMHWLFIYIFIFNAGIIQYLKNSFPWGVILGDSSILRTNIIIICWCILYYLSYNLKKFYPKKVLSKNINIENKFFLVIVTIMIGLFFIKYIGFSNLFSRSNSGSQMTEYAQSTVLIINIFVRAIPAIVLAYLLKENKFNKRNNNLVIIIIFILNLIVNFPTGTARYWAASIYLGLYVIIRPQENNKFFFCILFISVFLVAFPLLNEFRNATFSEVLNNGIKLNNFIDFFLAGDFDAYSMISRSYEVISIAGSTHGKQLLGSILFFIPRSIWIDKPIGSGAAVAFYQGQRFTNISCPIIGEGIVNFGIVGVILFAIILAFIIKYLDTLYWNSQREDIKSINVVTILYPFYLGFFFFIFRGDLMSSFAYLVGFSISAFIAQILFGREKSSFKIEQDVTLKYE